MIHRGADFSPAYDLIIIGGGITGAGILREAARANLKALLVEAHDFASGTSSRSSKLVHGGLRLSQQPSLQTHRRIHPRMRASPRPRPRPYRTARKHHRQLRGRPSSRLGHGSRHRRLRRARAQVATPPPHPARSRATLLVRQHRPHGQSSAYPRPVRMSTKPRAWEPPSTSQSACASIPTSRPPSAR